MNLDETTKMLSEMKNIIEENRRMKGVFEHYKEYAEKISKIGTELISLSKEIDPLSNTRKISSSGLNKKKIIFDFRTQIQSGTQVTRKLISSVYPSLDSTELNYILTELRKTKGVRKTYDGKEIRLFI